MKATSLEAWARLKYTGLLSRRQLDTLIALIKYGPMTGQEVTQYVPNGWKRLSELERMGAIVAGKTRICTITGEPATEWHVVGANGTAPTLTQMGLAI